MTDGARVKSRSALRVFAEIAALLTVGVLSGLLWRTVRPAGPGAGASAAVSCAAPTGPASTRPTISPLEASTLGVDPDVVFLDARTRLEFVAGHVAGAVNVPPSDRVALDRALPVLRAARTIVSYCKIAQECSCADDLAGRLVEAGLRDVRVLEGGIQAWVAAGYPAEAGGCSL